MKILMVTPRFSPVSGGGGFVATNTLCKALVKRGHTVEVWTSDFQLDKEFVLKEYMDNPSVCPFPAVVTLMGFHVTPLLCKLAKLAFKQKNHMWKSKNGKPIGYKQFDIIHLQGCRTFQDTVVAYYARKYKIPYVVSANGFPISGTWMHRLVCKVFDTLFSNDVIKGAALCIAGSETGVKEYLRAGAKKYNTTIIPVPYDLSIFNNLPPRGEFRKIYKIGANKPVVGFLGGLDHNKGVDFLCQSFAKIAEEKAGILVVAGVDLGVRGELEKSVKKLGISERVIFTGYISGRDKLEFLVDCDVCVFPSRAESGLPLAAVEAIMCGVPIIVNAGTGSMDDVRKIGCGIVSNPDMLHIHIQRMLSLKAFAKICVEQGQKYIRQNRSVAESIKKYEKIYTEAAN